MLIKVKSTANYGIKTIGVDVEVNVASRGMPAFEIVGLPSKAVAESKERVRTAIVNSQLDFPNKKITVNLAPADIPKEGSFYDLPIAVGIMLSEFGIDAPEDSLFYGELSLDGNLRHTAGTFLLALYAKEKGLKNVFVAMDSANEAAVFKEVNAFPVTSLIELLDHLRGIEKMSCLASKLVDFDLSQESFKVDMRDVLGQEQAKRALEIAAAGGHNALLVGTPGGGKTMLAKCMPSILPPLSVEESLETTRIYSSAGLIPPKGSLIHERPYRSPHHTTSYAGLIGGGAYPKPGEISLAHRGVLFLDEFPEFSRYVLESLRQPLEDGIVTISRSIGTITFPSRFILIAASNPCPCGYLNHPQKRCTCSQFQINRYQKRISGPILDRIDLYVHVRPVDVGHLTTRNKRVGETSAIIRSRVIRASKAQKLRFEGRGVFANSEMGGKLIAQFCPLDGECEQLLNSAIRKFNLSARSYFKVIKIARTIADLALLEDIKVEHIAEALQYRQANIGV